MPARAARDIDALSGTFSALADPTRRQIVERLRDGPKSAGVLAADFALSAPAVSKHLRVLRHTLLVEEERDATDARVRIYRLRAEPLQHVDAWIDHMRGFWALQLGAFARHVERSRQHKRSPRARPSRR